MNFILKFLQFIKSHLLISSIIILLLVSIIIILPVYFLVIKKSKNTNISEQETVSPVYPVYTTSPDHLGFCHASTTNGVDSPMRFMPIEFLDISKLGTQADNADTIKSNGVKYKWIRDTNNPLTIERQLNTNKYTSQVLNAYGEVPGKSGFYYVNKIISSYDPNNPHLSKDITMDIKPFTLTKYSQQCKI
jgi:hypothetical protein